MESQLNNAADVLDTAADLLERDGWIQGELYDLPPIKWNTHHVMTAPACVNGALNKATMTCFDVMIYDAPFECEASRARYKADQFLHDVVGTFDIVDWNDNPDRDKQEVLDALRLASKEARMEAESNES